MKLLHDWQRVDCHVAALLAMTGRGEVGEVKRNQKPLGSTRKGLGYKFIDFGCGRHGKSFTANFSLIDLDAKFFVVIRNSLNLISYIHNISKSLND